MDKFILAFACMLSGLAACTAPQVATATKYQADIAAACGVAMTLSPLAGPYAPWIVAGCSTEGAVAKLALDPTSLAWVNGLAAKVRSPTSGAVSPAEVKVLTNRLDVDLKAL